METTFLLGLKLDCFRKYNCFAQKGTVISTKKNLIYAQGKSNYRPTS